MPGRTLSIFIDESGDFGAYEEHSPYYIVSAVFHNQNIRACLKNNKTRQSNKIAIEAR